MERNKNRRKKSGTIAIRLQIDELSRFDELVERAKSRNHLADKSSVARELIGFPATPQTISEEDREFFITGQIRKAETASSGKLTAKQIRLLEKTEDLLVYGHSDDLDTNLAVGITANINAMWSNLKRPGPSSSTATKKIGLVKRTRSSETIKEAGRFEVRQDAIDKVWPKEKKN